MRVSARETRRHRKGRAEGVSEVAHPSRARARLFTNRMAERRRLPVLNNTPSRSNTEADPSEDEPRPPWHWVGFGTVAIFAGWLPLAYVAGALSRRIMAERFGADASKETIDAALLAMPDAEHARLMAIIALPSLAGLALAAFGGGVVVGRFGTGTGPREAALSGVATALMATALAWAGPSRWMLVASSLMVLVSAGGAAWGGHVGARRRQHAPKA